jgi:hypothetical protein
LVSFQTQAMPRRCSRPRISCYREV